MTATKKTAVKTAKKKAPEAPPPDFETALERLTEINERLESGEVTLDEAIALYTDGMKLAKYCQEKLSDAEQKIKILVEKGGRLVEEDFADGA
ncbi:MAG TPA: exodeoxyribonuclease VII small subunit [candidate division Zixibacteria bacterium]|nr:exodeoxyribonuclease VII small subunit [candidate division Zixibacteria bacterium]